MKQYPANAYETDKRPPRKAQSKEDLLAAKVPRDTCAGEDV